MTKPKLLIIGHARHGKDTVGDWFVKKGYTFVSSSRFVGEKAVWPAIQNAWRNCIVNNIGCDDPNCCAPTAVPTLGPYNSFEEAFQDRHNHRAFWYETIAAYNRPDRSRLGRELFAEYDMYVGLRNWHEFQALKLHKAFDLCIWVDASDRACSEATTSMTLGSDLADVVVDNNGTLDDLDKTLLVLYDKWVRPLERTKNKPKAVGQCPHCYNKTRITPCPVCNA